ncbi:hypothetical protein QTJ16_000635 [Diplocarpon rosae]|uniref:Uncharacterized protein n=1 Tax=Diplocarpon rosae TaxID=946125 RepID=A0AAD9T5N6_9HELO|nr:hypothetical protein QTJ16_000635 [Diplocarpon rosae]
MAYHLARALRADDEDQEAFRTMCSTISSHASYDHSQLFAGSLNGSSLSAEPPNPPGVSYPIFPGAELHSPYMGTPHVSTLSQYPHSTPSQSFPSPLAPPFIPTRLKPHGAELAALDDAHVQSGGHEERILDSQRMVGKGRREAREGEEEVKGKELRRVLDSHEKSRRAFVELASERLQAVLGERNAWGFELPDVPLTMTPTNRLYNPKTRTSPSLSSANTSPLSTMKRDRRKDSGIAIAARSPLSPLSPFGLSGQVDETTGKGLREWLLSRGKEAGSQRKRECRSIAFHDFTPDAQSGRHSNVLVACYNGGGLHERADIYEVDLPTACTDPTTGQTAATTETWIWFLISRPVLTLSASDTSTAPRRYRQSSCASAPPNLQEALRPPPDFNFPIPTSWVVFACPASNVTSYPEGKDDSAPPSHPAPNAPPLRRSQQNAFRTVHKRKDYDFSHQGVPLFEFSSSSLFPTPTRALHFFLSVDGLGGWDETDTYGTCSEREWKARVAAWGAAFDSLRNEQTKMDERVGRSRELEEPCAYRGIWWPKFFEGVYADEARWRRIREAMSKGKCRVVVRWAELEQQASTREREEDVFVPGFGVEEEGEDGVGLGVQLNGGSLGSSAAAGQSPKIRGRLAGRKAARSEARRRSGLAQGKGQSRAGSESLNAGLGRPLIGVGRETVEVGLVMADTTLPAYAFDFSIPSDFSAPLEHGFALSDFEDNAWTSGALDEEIEHLFRPDAADDAGRGTRRWFGGEEEDAQDVSDVHR